MLLSLSDFNNVSYAPGSGENDASTTGVPKRPIGKDVGEIWDRFSLRCTCT